MIRTSDVIEKARAYLSSDGLSALDFEEAIHTSVSEAAIPILCGFELVNDESTIAKQSEPSLRSLIKVMSEGLRYEEPV